MVGVAQRLEHWTVAPVVGGSNPLTHPKANCKLKIANLKFKIYNLQWSEATRRNRWKNIKKKQ